VGAWCGTIGCGDGQFPIISLASALPDNYNDIEDFFTGNIVGDYRPDLSAGTTKYLISIGGDVATAEGWLNFFTAVTNDTETFYRECKNRGMAGIDLDIEHFDPSLNLTPMVVDLCTELKKIDPNFLIMLTILVGSPEWFKDLICHDTIYDYLTLMLYNGGMYFKNGSGAGCDWNQWAELFLSKGTTGCETPLVEDRAIYVEQSNIQCVDPKKVVLGVIFDTLGTSFDSDMYTITKELMSRYQSAGIMLWVIPGGWTKKETSLDAIQQVMGITIDPSSCVVPDTCPASKVSCDGSCTCVATSCGKKKQSVTDEACSPCPKQTYWPCDQQGFCECGANT
jgi:hypothetical protein